MYTNYLEISDLSNMTLFPKTTGNNNSNETNSNSNIWKNINKNILFKALDVDKNGTISDEEMQNFMENPLSILKNLLNESFNNSTEKSAAKQSTSSNTATSRTQGVVHKDKSNGTNPGSSEASGVTQNTATQTKSTSSTKNTETTTSKPSTTSTANTQTINNNDGSKKVVEDKGNYTVETSYDASGKTVLEERIIKDSNSAYDVDANNPKVYSKTVYKNGVPSITTSVHGLFSSVENYDANGNVINQTSTNKTNGDKLIYNYKYDDKGNKISNKYTHYNANNEVTKKSEIFSSSNLVKQKSAYTDANGVTHKGWVMSPAEEMRIQTLTDEKTGEKSIIAVKDTNNANTDIGYSNRVWQKFDENGKILESKVINTNTRGGLKDSLDQKFDADGNVNEFVKTIRESDHQGGIYELKYDYKDGALISTKQCLYKDGKNVKEEAQALELSAADSEKIITANTQKPEQNNLEEAKDEKNSEIAANAEANAEAAAATPAETTAATTTTAVADPPAEETTKK